MQIESHIGMPYSLMFYLSVLFKRFEELLMAEEKSILAIEDNSTKDGAKTDEMLKNNDTTSSGEISLTDLTAKWAGSEETVLEDLNVEIKNGSLVGVIGQVGCGKSSLLSLLIDELEIVKGRDIRTKTKN